MQQCVVEAPVFKRSEVKILACIRGFASETRLRRFVFGVVMPWGSLSAGKKLISVHHVTYVTSFIYLGTYYVCNKVLCTIVHNLELYISFFHLEFLNFPFVSARFGLQNLPFMRVDFLFFL